jgi:hypothetical protein
VPQPDCFLPRQHVGYDLCDAQLFGYGFGCRTIVSCYDRDLYACLPRQFHCFRNFWARWVFDRCQSNEDHVPLNIVNLRKLIFRQFRETGRGQDEGAARELFETVKIYNAVPAEAEESYREAVLREYAAFCKKEKQP